MEVKCLLVCLTQLSEMSEPISLPPGPFNQHFSKTSPASTHILVCVWQERPLRNALQETLEGQGGWVRWSWSDEERETHQKVPASARGSWGRVSTTSPGEEEAPGSELWGLCSGSGHSVCPDIGGEVGSSKFQVVSVRPEKFTHSSLPP